MNSDNMLLFQPDFVKVALVAVLITSLSNPEWLPGPEAKRMRLAMLHMFQSATEV